MRGIRAVRVGFFLAGVLATVAGSGCCSDCCSLCGGKSKSQTSESLPTDAKAGEPKSQADEVLKQWRPANRFSDQTEHVAPEHIHGGIY